METTPKRPTLVRRPRSAYAIPPPTDPWLADKEALIQAAFQTCNQVIAILVAEQTDLRKRAAVSGTGSAPMAARYRDLEDQRRHVLRQRHQVQVASFTLEQQPIDYLTQWLATLLQTVSPL